MTDPALFFRGPRVVDPAGGRDEVVDVLPQRSQRTPITCDVDQLTPLLADAPVVIEQFVVARLRRCRAVRADTRFLTLP